MKFYSIIFINIILIEMGNAPPQINKVIHLNLDINN